MGVFRFFSDMKFNFVNFFAYSFFVAYVFLSAIIIIQDAHANNPHVAEIRNQIGNICLLIVGFYFGASKGSKQKDDSLQEVIKQNAQKDEVLKTMVQDAKDIASNTPTPIIPSKLDVTISDKKDE